MNFQERYRIGMFRDTGMTPDEIAKQLHHSVKTIKKILTDIDQEKDREHHFTQISIGVRVWDTVLKTYISRFFLTEVDFKSYPYQEGIDKISDSIKKLVEPEREKLL